jgi:hypothetical protein
MALNIQVEPFQTDENHDHMASFNEMKAHLEIMNKIFQKKSNEKKENEFDIYMNSEEVQISWEKFCKLHKIQINE